jgi:hypothetical protein
MKTRFLYLLSVLLITLSSCQKEVTDPDVQPTTGGTGGTGGTGNTGSGTYLPLTKNTFWKFQDSASGAITIMTVLDKTTTINGKLFTDVLGSNSTQTDTGYMTRQGADYFTYAQVNNGTSSGNFLFHYLNDTAAAGSSWEYIAGQGNGYVAYIKTTIVERNLSRTVAGKTYTDVIHTRMDLSYDLGERVDAGYYDYYTAKNIGIIQVKSRLGMFGSQFAASSDLVDYQIK